MAGPSPAFLAALNAGLAPQPTLDIPADTITPQGAAYAPAPAVYNAPQSQAWQPPADPFGTSQAPTNASGVPNPPLDSKPVPLPPTGTYGKQGTYGPPNPAATPVGAPVDQPVQPAQGDLPPDVQFSPVASGGSPAREVSTRGPKQEALMERSFEHPMLANEQIRDRSQEQALREQQMYEHEANVALERQAAFERQAARRAQELQMLQADYQQTISDLSRFKVDNNRVWNNTSTLDKIGATLLAIIGGAAAGPGGNNIVLQSLMGTINEDVDNQKRAYEAGLDFAKGQQTAYGMAMQRFNSEDAAYHAAMAAGQEAVAMKIAGMKAQWKGTDSANQADAVAGDLLFKADQNAAAGLKYLQPTMGSTKYKMKIRGYELPDPVTGAEANRLTVEHAVKTGERADDELLKGGVQSRLQSQKAQAERATKGDEGAKYISQQLQTAGIPQARTLAERALTSLNKSPGGFVDSTGRKILGQGGSEFILSDDSNQREQDYHAFRNAAMKILFGNVTAAEESRADKQFGSGSSPESRKRSINAMLAAIEEQERNIIAGASQQSADTYSERRGGASTVVGRPMAPAGAKGGWK
jgi:hypothetical protein